MPTLNMTLSILKRPAASGLAVAMLTGFWACQPPKADSAAGAPKEAAQGAALGQPQSKREVPPKLVEVQAVSQADFVEAIELSASTEASQDAVLSAQAAGSLVFLAELGTRVKPGEVLARIDPGLAKATQSQALAGVRLAEAQLRLAKDHFDRQKPLFEGQVISALEFQSVKSQKEQAEAGLRAAQANLRAATTALSYTTLRAPFAAVVEARFTNQGAQLMPGSPVLRLVNTQPLKVKGGVPERYAGDIRVGSRFKLRFNAYEMPEVEGELSFVGSLIDPQSRSFEVQAKLPNLDGRLKPEMVARMFVERRVYPAAIALPLTATLRDNRGVMAFVIETEGARRVAKRRALKLGPVSGEAVVVLEGLKPGEQVVTRGQANLTEGDRVVTGAKEDTQ